MDNFIIILRRFWLNTNENLQLSNVKEFLIFLSLFPHGIYLKNNRKVQKLLSVYSRLLESTRFRQSKAALLLDAPSENSSRGREESCR